MDYTVDVQETRMYMDLYNEPCTCAYCENYRQAFPSHYPAICKLLTDMGLHIDRPLEIMDFFWANAAHTLRRYESYYCVKGELAKDGLILYDRDAMVTLYRHDTKSNIYQNTAMQAPYFILCIDNIKLPWTLPTTLED